MWTKLMHSLASFIQIQLVGRMLWGNRGDRYRPLFYLGSHVVILVFSIASWDSLEVAQTVYPKEVQSMAPAVPIGIPIILVGCHKVNMHVYLVCLSCLSLSLKLLQRKTGY